MDFLALVSPEEALARPEHNGVDSQPQLVDQFVSISVNTS
jgi:hypothetical protein